MARPGVVAVLDTDVSWPPFRLERVVLFSVQGFILQQLVTVAKHLQRPTRLRLVRHPLQRLGSGRAVGVEPAARGKALSIVLVKNHRFSIKIKSPLPKKSDDRYLCGFPALGPSPRHSLSAAAAHPQQPGAVHQREVVNGRALLTWPAQYQPSDSFRGHFEFGLKYERTG